MAAKTVRNISIEYLDGSLSIFPASVIIQCSGCGAFFVGSAVIQQLRVIPSGE